jgi:DNA repair exonuclease SbcCD nuclease subunit
MRLIHSSDLQIGKAFGQFDVQVATQLQAARMNALKTLGDLAVRHKASAILLAGDTFDRQQISMPTIQKAFEQMRACGQVTWHLLPGNGDAYGEYGVWERLTAAELPENVRLHIAPGPVKIAHQQGVPIYLLPAPTLERQTMGDPTEYMDTAATPEGAVRIGLAHSRAPQIGVGISATSEIASNRGDAAGLSYLALGGYHAQRRIADRTWYSGTPEPDEFLLPVSSSSTLCMGGNSLLVEVNSATAKPAVVSLETGRYRWHYVEKTLNGDAQISFLENELRVLERDLSRMVLALRVGGTLSLAGRRLLEQRIVNSMARELLGIHFTDTDLVPQASQADLDEIDRTGFVRTAAERLRTIATDPENPERARLASLALQRLYQEHLRTAGQP